MEIIKKIVSTVNVQSILEVDTFCFLCQVCFVLLFGVVYKNMLFCCFEVIFNNNLNLGIDSTSNCLDNLI